MIVLAAGASTAGPIGLLIVLLLGLATVLLIRNMDKRVKKLPAEFPPPPGAPPGPPDVAPPAGSDRP